MISDGGTRKRDAQISGATPDRQTLPKRLEGLETGIRNGLWVLQSQLDELLKNIEKYLNC
jgi:hypothetical protein